MKMRNMLVVLLILLLVICAVSYIFILADNTNKINNDSIFNNSTNLQNKHDDKNISLNHTNNTDDGIEGNINNNYYKSSSSNNHKHDKNDYNDSYDEAMEAKLYYERHANLEKNEIVGYPVYKDPDLNAWLVPIFDKYTKEFKGSTYLCGKPGYHYYVHGPEFYSEYKRVISGKTPKSGPDITSSEAAEINRVPDYTERYVLAAANPEVKDNYPSSNIPLDTQSESVVELDLNQYYPAESNETA